jgi:hypothetical protein
MQTTANFQKSAKHTSSGLHVFAMNEIIHAIDNNDQLEKLNYVLRFLLGAVKLECWRSDLNQARLQALRPECLGTCWA